MAVELPPCGSMVSHPHEGVSSPEQHEMGKLLQHQAVEGSGDSICLGDSEYTISEERAHCYNTSLGSFPLSLTAGAPWGSLRPKEGPAPYTE